MYVDVIDTVLFDTCVVDFPRVFGTKRQGTFPAFPARSSLTVTTEKREKARKRYVSVAHLEHPDRDSVAGRQADGEKKKTRVMGGKLVKRLLAVLCVSQRSQVDTAHSSPQTLPRSDGRRNV